MAWRRRLACDRATIARDLVEQCWVYVVERKVCRTHGRLERRQATEPAARSPQSVVRGACELVRSGGGAQPEQATYFRLVSHHHHQRHNQHTVVRLYRGHSVHGFRLLPQACRRTKTQTVCATSLQPLRSTDLRPLRKGTMIL